MKPWPPRVCLLALALVACGAPAGGPEPTETTSEALSQCAMADIEGVDVYDGTGTIDWATAKGAGIAFALMKATQGTYNTQSTFAANWSGTKAAGIYRSAYHFFDPTEDGVAQANHYLAVVGAIGAGELPPMLDIECPDGDANCLYMGGSGQAAPADIKTRMWDWIHTVEAATGKKPLIYTFPAYFTGANVDPTGLEAYPLYIADIVSGNCTTVPAPWSSAAFWQYSWNGTVAGIGVPVDQDRFMGTLAGLGMLAQGGAPDAGAGDAGSGGAEGGADAASPQDSGASPGDDGSASDTGGGPTTGDAGGGAATPGSGGAGGCGCGVASRRASLAWIPGLVLAVALGLRRRHARASVLAGAPRTTCRRPTSARA